MVLPKYNIWAVLFTSDQGLRNAADWKPGPAFIGSPCITEDIQGVRAKFDTFCFHYISELLQDIDIG